MNQEHGRVARSLRQLMNVPEAQVPEMVEKLNFSHYFLQPKDEEGIDNTDDVIDYCRTNPKWRLSLQTHKIIGIS